MPTYNITSPIVDDPSGAMQLNGTTDYASKAVTTYGSTHTAGSVAGWVKTTASSGDLVIFAVADTATANEAFFFQVDSTNGKLAVGTIIGGTANEVRGSTTINDDEWYYVTATTDGTAWSLYVDGVPETLTVTTGSNDGSWWFDLTGADNVTLGALVQNTTSGYYTSGLDEVAIWDYQISGDEVYDHYSEGLSSYATDNTTTIPALSATVTTYAPSSESTEHHFSGLPAIILAAATTPPGAETTTNPRSSIATINAVPTNYAPESATTGTVSSAIASTASTLTVRAPLAYTDTPGGCLAVTIAIGGTDVTSSVAGAIRVEEEERSSSIAEFNCLLGTTIAARASVVIDIYDGTSTRRLFTGIVAERVPQVDQGIISVLATTDLQGKVRALTRPQIKSLIGGYWHPAISDERGDEWEFCQEVLDTVPRDLHVNRNGTLTMCDWTVADTVTITDADRVAGSMRGSIAQTSNIVNRNVVTVQHRYTRRKLRKATIVWSQSTAPTGHQGEGNTTPGWPLPDEDMARSFVEGLGWSSFNVSFDRPWDDVDISDEHYFPIAGKPGYHRVVDNDPIHLSPLVTDYHETLITGFSAQVYQTWDQTILNNYSIDVKSSSSIAAIGEFAVTEEWTAEEPEPDEIADAPVSATAGQPVLGVGTVNLFGGATLPNGDQYIDFTGDADMDGLMQAAVARASTEILSSHRQHTEEFTCPYAHDYRLDRRGSVTGMITCAGKIKAIRTLIDPQAGLATQDISLAISGMDAQGVDAEQPYQVPETPANDPETSISYNLDLSTQIGGFETSPQKPELAEGQAAYFTDYFWQREAPELYLVESYGRSFEGAMLSIADADVDDREQTIPLTVIVDVPVDPYEINATGDCP